MQEEKQIKATSSLATPVFTIEIANKFNPEKRNHQRLPKVLTLFLSLAALATGGQQTRTSPLIL